jgi:hypothetical protein
MSLFDWFCQNVVFGQPLILGLESWVKTTATIHWISVDLNRKLDSKYIIINMSINWNSFSKLNYTNS